MLPRNSTVETLVKGLEGIKCTQEIVEQGENEYFGEGREKEEKVLGIFKNDVLRNNEAEINLEETKKLKKENFRPLWGYGIESGKVKCDAILCYRDMKFLVELKVINKVNKKKERNEYDVGVALLQGVAYPIVYDVNFFIALIYDGGNGVKYGYEWKKGDEERRVVDLFIKEYPMIIVRARLNGETQVFYEYSSE